MFKKIFFSVATLLSLLSWGSTQGAGSLLDPTFAPGTGAGGGLVEQVLPLSNGKILVCGNFTSFNGRNKAYIAKLNHDGSVDDSFHAQPGYWVRNMSVQGDGKVVIGGFFTTVEGIPRNLVARLNTDGSLDRTFDPGSGATNIIAGGIDGNITPFVFWTAVQPDGKILLTGNFRNYNGSSSIGLVRVNHDGSRDTSFNVGNGLDSWGRHILLLPNGQILLSGWFTSYNNKWCNRMVRINPDGSPDPSFNPFFGDHTAVYSTALAGGGKIIAVGHSLNAEGLFRREMARLNTDGTIDESFIGFTNEKTESTVIQADGKIIVAGYFTKVNDRERSKVGRLNEDGTLDEGFSANIDNFVWSSALQNDGKLLISGGFNTVDGVSRGGVARLITGAPSGPGTPPTTGGGSTGGNTPPPQDSTPTLNVAGSTATSVTLSWSDSSKVRTGYNVERKTGGVHTVLATVGSAVRNYTITGLSPGFQYIFRLKGLNSIGGSVYSTAVTVKTPVPTGGSNPSAIAGFVGTDTATVGSWKGKYGAEGFMVIGEKSSIPGYVTVTTAGKSDWTWKYSTQDSAAVQRSEGTDRLAAGWYSATSYSIDLRFSDTTSHSVSAYFLDWDKMGRVQLVEVTDGDSGKILDSRTVSGFGDGVYYTWNLSGHVKITLTSRNGNAVASGLFFGAAGGSSGGSSSGTTGGTTQSAAAPSISPNGGSFTTIQQILLSTATSGGQIRFTLDGSEPTASSLLYSGPLTLTNSTVLKAKTYASGYNSSATSSGSFTINTGGANGVGGTNFRFIGADDKTQGNWRGVYGKDGYQVFAQNASYPGYVRVTPSGNQEWIWKDSTSDPRALQSPDGANRIASCWYAKGLFDVGITFTDGATHRLAIYLCDWDNSKRIQKVELIDGGSGVLLHSETVSEFSGGRYLIWDVKGSVKLRFTNINGSNAVLNGLFFQPAPTALK